MAARRCPVAVTPRKFVQNKRRGGVRSRASLRARGFSSFVNLINSKLRANWNDQHPPRFELNDSIHPAILHRAAMDCMAAAAYARCTLIDGNRAPNLRRRALL